MSAQLQEAYLEFERAITAFTQKYCLSNEVIEYLISCGKKAEKKRLTTQTRQILATLYHKNKELGTLKILRNDVKSTFAIGDSTFDDLKKVSGFSNTQILKIDIKDTRRSQLDCKYPLMESKLTVYLQLCQKKLGVVHSGPFIQTQAMVFFDQLKATRQIPEESAFAASNGWLQGYKQRRNIQYKASRGTTDTINKEEAYKLLDDIIRNNGILKYSAHDIFNLDETAFFWRTLAKRGLIFGDEAPKVGLSKDRVTLVVAASMTGEKLPLCLIGTANQPQGFNNRQQLDLKERHKLFYAFKKKTAWMTRKTFFEYLQYLDEYFKINNRKIVMLCDAPSVHLLGSLDKNSQLIIQAFDNIKLIYLPSNCTCVLQPADQGIIRSFKAKYRYHLLTTLCDKADGFIKDDNPESRLETFKLNQFIRFKDAVQMARDTWDQIEPSVIVNAWVKSSIASYWNISKTKSTLFLHQRALKKQLSHSKSIFKDLDIFNEFTVYEDMGDMDYKLLCPLDIQNEVLDIVVEVLPDLHPAVEIEEVVEAPSMIAYDLY